MIIISDCLTDNTDEGTIKIASKIARLLKKKNQAEIFELNRTSSFSDKTFTVGKSGISRELLTELSKKKGNVLYIPNASMTLNTCLRVCILSVLSRKKVFLLPVYRRKVNKKMRMLLAMSKVEIIALSEESFRVYKGCLPNKVHYVKAGVDTVQFTEIESKQRKTLREKFGYSDTDTIVLHTGHMVEARNIRKLMDLDKSFKIILIISTSTRWDENLYNDLKQCPNINIIHKYIPKIEEYFQIADVYYFPVEEVGCVDVPLSVLEAAACGTPVVTTPYGELNAFKETKSFKFINDFAESNFLIKSVKDCRENNNRNQILEYDWNHVVERLCSIMRE